MGIFDSFKKPDINTISEEVKREQNTVILDVRTPQEYREGHIPGSRNIPLDEIQKAERAISDKNTALRVYCFSGGRSRVAAAALKQMGFANVRDYGGINRYRGKVVQ